MKKQLLFCSVATLISIANFAKAGEPRICFTENKGQVHDQFYKPRTDVTYGVTTGNMAVHIKTNGVSYQLYRVDEWKDVDRRTLNKVVKGVKELKKEIAKQSIYRIDLSWMGSNENIEYREDEALLGYSNYYLTNCPDGAVYVKSYKGVTLKELYQGIDVHYYEKDGELKHDYIVAAHADYKKIQVQVDGANISINDDGSLFLSTPLGVVQEGAPLVFQNGKQLKAGWTVTNNILSFEVENYDANYELLIDPMTRIWGTFFGGSTNESGQHCASDANGNIYLGGYTNSTGTGTSIATVGAHQTTTAGGGFDAFVAKFSGSGLRLWSTFYGGALFDGITDCATDASGNVFATGTTFSNAGTSAIATPGSHQPVFGAGTFTSTADAFLVKFDANGVRQWGTYYGGLADDDGSSVATDASGNVYLAGSSEFGGGAAIATSGGHQPAYGGGFNDAFIAKFSPAGVRLWGTYYGNSSDDYGGACATDASGNVYLTGLTFAASSTFTTPGCHQSTHGGATDAFLVKFDANGARLWSTFYGGNGDEWMFGCATDASGNVFISGETASNNGTTVATAGAHQMVHGGSSNDAFLVKFDASGARQWGTYYGGSQDDNGRSCATDAAGNVYLTGITGSSSGTVMATTGSQQTAYGGQGDAFLVKFSPTGARLAGTFYGGTGIESGIGCAVDPSGNVYMSGSTSSNGTIIATPGTHQSTSAGSGEAFLVKMDVCSTAPSQPSAINGPTSVCSGETASYTTALVSGVVSYTLWLPGGGSAVASNNTIVANPVSSGNFTLVAGNSCGVSPGQTINVNVNPSPTVVVNSGTICAGQSFTLVPGGAATYSYSAGPVVSPNTTSTYSVTGTNTFGCSNTVLSTVIVYTLPAIAFAGGSVCAGQSFTLVASGANSYTYSSGPVITPASTDSYTVIGTSSQGCSTVAVADVTVYPLPNVGTTSSHTVLCVGETATITATGAANYTFTPGGLTNTITTGSASAFTLEGVDAMGCRNTAIVTQSVSPCADVNEWSVAGKPLVVYPNPGSGILNVTLAADNEIVIVNIVGQIVFSSRLSAGRQQIDLGHLAKGIYVLKTMDSRSLNGTRVVIE